MPPRRCCCSTDCTLLIDDFERADSTSLGSDWTEESGDSEIVSGALVMSAGDAVATVVANTSRRGVATLQFTTTGSGPWEIEVTLNYGSVNQCTVTVEFSSTYLTLTAGTQTRTITSTDIGQPSSLLWGLSPSNTYVLDAALTNNLLYVRLMHVEVDPVGAAVWDHEFTLPTTGDRRLGIAVVSGTIEIDAVNYLRHFDDTNLCPDYVCVCDPTFPRRFSPWKTRIDFFSDDVSGGCSSFDGGYLYFENVLQGGTETAIDRWECTGGLVAGQAFGWGTGNVPFYECNTTIDSQTIYGVSFGACIAVDALDPSVIDCNPFSVTFRTFEFSDIPTECDLCTGTTGSFYAIMTDDT